jgi:hypothetical protein
MSRTKQNKEPRDVHHVVCNINQTSDEATSLRSTKDENEKFVKEVHRILHKKKREENLHACR